MLQSCQLRVQNVHRGGTNFERHICNKHGTATNQVASLPKCCSYLSHCTVPRWREGRGLQCQLVDSRNDQARKASTSTPEMMSPIPKWYTPFSQRRRYSLGSDACAPGHEQWSGMQAKQTDGQGLCASVELNLRIALESLWYQTYSGFADRWYSPPIPCPDN